MDTYEMNTTVIANAKTEQEQTPVYDADYYTQKAIELFDDLGVEGDYTKHGIKANIDAWLSNKAPLFDLLRKHPNWDEKAKAVIIPAFEEIRESNNTNKYKKINELVCNCFSERDLDSFEEKIPCDNVVLLLADLAREQFIEESNPLIPVFNRAYPDLKIHNGQKASRVINKLMGILGVNKHPNYNKYYAAFADACNPLTVKRTSVLSANWLDFMTMSNGNSWSSCHGITPTASYDGCYKAGCMSYGNDDTSLIFYTIEEGHTEDYFAVKKITRQIIFWEYPVMVQERLYPQSNDNDDGKGSNSLVKQYRELVEKIFSVCTETPNLWERTNKITIQNRSDTFMYQDWIYFNNWIVKIKDVDIKSNEIYVGEACYCLECGLEKYDNNNNDEGYLYCDDCRDYNSHYCDHCGEQYDEEDLHYCSDTEELLCPECCGFCDYHDDYEATYPTRFIDRDLTCVHNYGYVCEEALNEGNFFYCDHCEQWYSDSNNYCHYVDDASWCDNCTSQDAVWCDGCEQYHEDYNLITYTDSITGKVYCSDYATENDMVAECEECGCVDLIANMNEENGRFYCDNCENEKLEQTA